jgi:hypothetical protein
MDILQQTPNPNFEQAWEYVDRNYAYLIRDTHLDRVMLLDEEDHAPGCDGLHIWDKLLSRSQITVCNGGFDTAKFVEILVHELTHLTQYASGRGMGMSEYERESEAYPAGMNAMRLYELRELEAFAETLKAARIAAAVRRWGRR